MYLNTNYTIVIGSLLTNPAESEWFGLWVCCCEVGKKADFATSFHSAQFAAKCWVICFWICSFYCGVRGAFCESDLCRLWTPGSHPLDFRLRSEGDSNTILQYFYSICKCFLCKIIRIYNKKWDRLYTFYLPNLLISSYWSHIGATFLC